MSHHNLTYINHCIEHDLAIVSNWFKVNLLTLNPTKTVAMWFIHKKSIDKITNVKLENTELPFVMETKFLGMWLDENLSWNSHLNKLSTKLKRNLHLLAKLSGFQASCEHLNKIKKIHNKCMKLIKPKLIVMKTYNDLKLLNLDKLINLENKKTWL